MPDAIPLTIGIPLAAALWTTLIVLAWLDRRRASKEYQDHLERMTRLQQRGPW